MKIEDTKQRTTIYLNKDELEKFKTIAGRQNLSATLDGALRVINILLENMPLESVKEQVEKKFSDLLKN